MPWAALVTTTRTIFPTNSRQVGLSETERQNRGDGRGDRDRRGILVDNPLLPVIRGTRLTVESMLEFLAAGQSQSDILPTSPFSGRNGAHRIGSRVDGNA